ncbi:MAG TPA: ABC transporter ATP-binding protein [Anaerolineales bacterium]|nr:ABC transporter ATP-binding protein [Anaerolineales bacterium]
MKNDLVLEAKGLTKRYGNFVAVDHLDLAIRKGEVFGLLGPNGAGKTTTILMLLGLTEPTEGTVRVLGFDPARQPLSVKARVGYMPDQVGFYDELTARENLTYIAKLNGIPRDQIKARVEEAIERVHLSHVIDQAVGTFSRGMRQRLGLADVLVKKPQLIIMDEPTQGLDPELAREFLNLIRSLKEEGITILLSSHLLHQVQAICDRVGLFSRGRMELEGTVPDLARRVLGGAYRIHIEADGPVSKLKNALQELSQVTAVHHLNGRFEIEAEDDIRADAASTIIKAGGKLHSLSIETQSLDEIYTRYFKEVQHVAST